MHTDTARGARCFQALVPIRDGIRLNTCVFLPENGGPHSPVIVHRTPSGITVPGASGVFLRLHRSSGVFVSWELPGPRGDTTRHEDRIYKATSPESVANLQPLCQAPQEEVQDQDTHSRRSPLMYRELINTIKRVGRQQKGTGSETCLHHRTP